jgi:asparagine N-glycosylation enzyme membrane subunit Stt3
MMENENKNSWSVLIAGMALAYALARWVGSRIPYLFTPITFFVKFVTEKYANQINRIGECIQSKINHLWNILLRRKYAKS